MECKEFLMTLFTKRNLLFVSLFVAGCCFLIWLSRRAKIGSPYYDTAKFGGVMLSMMADHSTPSIVYGGNTQPREIFVEEPVRPVNVQPKRHRFTQKQRHYIASIQGYSCFICSNQLSKDLKDTDIDHILPLNLGGNDWPDLSNLAALHAACHRRKTQLERSRQK